MPSYTLTLELVNAGNADWKYSVELEAVFEDKPQYFFSKCDGEESLKFTRAIEGQLLRQAASDEIERMLTNWCKAIAAGERTTTLRVSLPLLKRPDAVADVSTTKVSSIEPAQTTREQRSPIPAAITDLRKGGSRQVGQAKPDNPQSVAVPEAPKELVAEKVGQKISADDLE
jgi:hypothetical protein